MTEHWGVKYWRDFPNARNAKIAFILVNEDEDEDRRKVPDDLMTVIVAELKKDVDYDNATMMDKERREHELLKAICSRPEGTTITSVYKRLSDEWGIEEDSVKKIHNRIKRKRRGQKI